MLFFATELEERRKEFSGIHLDKFIGHLLVFLRYAGLFVSKLG
jgi:hypothetical protein